MIENWSQMNSKIKINNKFWENASHQFLQNGFDIHLKLLCTCDWIIWVRFSSGQSCLYRRLSGWRIWGGTKDTDIVEQYSLNEYYPPATIYATCLKSTTGLALHRATILVLASCLDSVTTTIPWPICLLSWYWIHNIQGLHHCTIEEINYDQTLHWQSKDFLLTTGVGSGIAIFSTGTKNVNLALNM